MTGPTVGEVATDPEPQQSQVASSTSGRVVLHRARSLLRRRAPYVFPGIVLLVFLALVVTGITGTSIGIMGRSERTDSALIAGNPNFIRGDEWIVRTPLILGQLERGFPDHIQGGVSENDAAVLYYLPTTDWSMAFKPQLVGFLVLPERQAFAFDWWGSAVILMLGVYAFLLVVVRDWRWAAVGALLMYGAPFMHWWYLPITTSLVGFAAGGFAALLIALREPDRWRRRIGWSVFAGFLFACSAFPLYPPFLVTAMLVFGAVALAVVVRWFRQRQLNWWGLIAVLAIAAVIPACALALFAAQHAEAFAAINATVYPGQRRIAGGTGISWREFAGSWFSWKMALRPSVNDGANSAAKFGAANAPMIGVFLIPTLPIVWTALTRANARLRYVLVAILGVFTLFVLHVVVGLPSFVGQLTLINRVPLTRIVMGFGLVAMLMMVAVGVASRGVVLPLRRRLLAGALLTTITGLTVGTLALRYHRVGAPISSAALVATVMCAVLVAALFYWRPMVSALLLAALSLLIVFPVAPLYRGLYPLRDEAYRAELVDAVPQASNGRWISTSGDLSAFLIANGFTTLSSVQMYPDAETWRVLDPSGAQEQAWNRYAHTLWNFDERGSGMELSNPRVDTVVVKINPCDPALARLNVTFVASADPIGSCFETVGTITSPGGRPLVISRRIGS